MLQELAKRDKEWRILALKICNCKIKADDLVQDMYIKLRECKEFNTAYVYFTMKHIFIDWTRKKAKNKEILYDDFRNIQNNYNESYTTQDRYELLDKLKNLTWWEREVLLITHEMSLRKAEEETGIHYTKLNYHKNKGLNKLKERYGNSK